MDEMSDIIREFLLESYEGLDLLERDLMDYEKNPADQERLTALFRVLHTLKGTGGFLGFSRLEKLSHAGESVLVLLRDGKITMTPGLTSLLLNLLDVLRGGLRRIEADGVEEQADDGVLLERLKSASETVPSPRKLKEPPPVAVAGAPATGPGQTPSSAPGQADSTSSPHAGGAEESVLRVPVKLLDQLMNLTGEMVLVRNQAHQWAESHDDPALNAVLQPLNQLALGIQEGVMKARLQPLSQLFSRFPRLVRDTARACGKNVILEMRGSETEIDRSILEAIRDPLTHLLRNAIDHGIEKPEERKKAGKDGDGRIILKAVHEAGTVLLEVGDDGGGLPLDKIKEKAVKEGLLTREQANGLGPEGVAQLIFRPGFSTAEHLTAISGRGVGLDVVKANLEKTGGKVEVHSVPGQGTTFKLKIPLTLSSLAALVIRCGNQNFVVPRVHLQEIIRVQEGAINRRIEYLPEAPVFRLRGKLLPLLFLREVLKLGEQGEFSSFHILVLKSENLLFGLVLDEVTDFQEVMVKPLGRHLKAIPFYMGTTVLGDGQVALILDVMGLAQRCQSVPIEAGRAAAVEENKNFIPLVKKSQMALIFLTPDDGRMAMPLEKVLRLEAFRCSAVEKAGNLEVIQYEGKVLPLVYVSRMLPERRQIPRQEASTGGDEKMQVVMYDNGREEVGLVVDRVLDIVTAPLEVQRAATRSYVKGSMVLQERVTELLDIPALLKAAGLGEEGHGS
jgi:two-component system chemotaxis sensor kinase CheA